MSERRGRIGPGASTVLMIVVMLLMTMLGVLSLMSARGDMSLSERALKSSIDYYNAQTEFGLWITNVDTQLYELRALAGGDAQAYAEAVRERFSITIGEAMEFSAAAGAGRVLRCGVEILPIAETDRFRLLYNRLEAVSGEELEEDEGWNLIS